MIGIGLGFWYTVIFVFTKLNPDPLIKKESWTVQTTFYNPSTQNIDSIYGNAQAFNDTVISFEGQNHKLWRKNNFLTYKEDVTESVPAASIMLRNGFTYKILYIDSGRCCKARSVLDSLKDSNETIEDDDYN